MRRAILILFSWSISWIITSTVFAQAPALPSQPPVIFGADLRTWIRDNWYTGKFNNLSYNEARRQMFGYIDRTADGKVLCVYTGFSTTADFTTTRPADGTRIVNTEHTVPQSFFNQLEPMRSDLHHLFPTHETPNADRADFPFREVPDNLTNKWMTSGTGGNTLIQQTTIPSSNIDAYSELRNNTAYEPREDHKGNVARAIFYFYTVYTQYNITEIAPTAADLQTLYDWHLQDPVNETERQRNRRIAEKQGNYNPYIEYPEALGRAWGFVTTASENEVLERVRLCPNPVREYLEIHNPTQESIGLLIRDAWGNTRHRAFITTSLERLSLPRLPAGIYWVELQNQRGSITHKICILAE